LEREIPSVLGYLRTEGVSRIGNPAQSVSNIVKAFSTECG
jgi:hypothetical protein